MEMAKKAKKIKPGRKPRASSGSKPAVAPVEKLTGNPALDQWIILAREVGVENMMVIRQEQREQAFILDYGAMQMVMPEIDQDGSIEIKEGKARGKMRFATHANIHRQILPVLRAHHFSIWHEIRVGEGGVGIIVHTTLKHDMGHYTESFIPLIIDTSGSKNNNQGAGSSSTYGKRYNTIALCNIISCAPGDADLDGYSPERIVRKTTMPTQNPGLVATQNESPPAETTMEVLPAKDEVATIDMEQAQRLCAAISDNGVPMPMFIKKYGEPAMLPVVRFYEAIQACVDYGHRMGKNKNVVATGRQP
jgi:hypothetical protein